MTIVDQTAPDQGAALAFEFDLPHAPAKVWRALTDPALLAEWLLPTVGFAPEPGTTFSFRRDPMPGWDGVVHCRVLEVDPGRMLRYAWVVGDMDTVVRFTLAPSATGTRLSLVHSGFLPTQRHNFGGARYGWRQMGGKLEGVLAVLD
jgi:uncharacterized protein YndB with AHSA1/START domain